MENQAGTGGAAGELLTDKAWDISAGHDRGHCHRGGRYRVDELCRSTPSRARPMTAAGVVAISGASRGIGLATAPRFARHGHDVSFCYHTNETAKLELANEIEGLGVRTPAAQVDVTPSETNLGGVFQVCRAAIRPRVSPVPWRRFRVGSRSEGDPHPAACM
jgi:hypothetical protein